MTRRLNRYQQGLESDKPQRRKTAGRMHTDNANRSRNDEVTFINYASTEHLFCSQRSGMFGRDESPTCPDCGEDKENSIHWLLRYPRWDKERFETYGQQHD